MLRDILRRLLARGHRAAAILTIGKFMPIPKEADSR